MMRTQSKSKSLLIAIIILLLANIGLLAFFILDKEPEKKGRHEERKKAITTFLKKEVGFDEYQLRQFDSVSDQHWKKTTAMFDTVKSKKEEQLKLVGQQGFSDSAINSIANIAAARQRLMEIQMLQHIREIRNLCTPSQLPVFDSLFYKVFARKKDVKKREEKQ